MRSPELEAIQVRVANGISWLSEHDDGGAFHIWFESGLTANSPMPGQRGDPERVAAWQAYYKQRRIWEQLWKAMTDMERKEGLG